MHENWSPLLQKKIEHTKNAWIQKTFYTKKKFLQVMLSQTQKLLSIIFEISRQIFELTHTQN